MAGLPCPSRTQVRRLAKQLELGVAANRRAGLPLQLSYTSFSGPLRHFAERCNALAWEADLHEAGTFEVFEPAHVS